MTQFLSHQFLGALFPAVDTTGMLLLAMKTPVFVVVGGSLLEKTHSYCGIIINILTFQCQLIEALGVLFFQSVVRLASNGSVSPTVDAKLVPPISVIIILFSVVHVPVGISNAILKCCFT